MKPRVSQQLLPRLIIDGQHPLVDQGINRLQGGPRLLYPAVEGHGLPVSDILCHRAVQVGGDLAHLRGGPLQVWHESSPVVHIGGERGDPFPQGEQLGLQRVEVGQQIR